MITADVSKGDLLEAYALEICGIAFTTNIPSVLVNSFGPIAYCKLPLSPLLLTIHFLRLSHGLHSDFVYPL